MPLHAPDATNCFFAQEELPSTLKKMQAKAQVVPLGNDITALALAGVQWKDALISTRNDAAIISGRGGYGRYQATDCAFNVSRAKHRLDIRVNAEAGPNLSGVSAGSGRFISAFSTDDAEAVQHRVQVNTAHDHAVLSLFETTAHAAIPSQAVISNVLHLSAVRRARETWNDSAPGHHLNDMLLHQGRTRFQCLPHVGKGRAWQVAANLLGSFLAFLCDRKISVTRGVVAKGILQLDRGLLGADHTANGVMLMQDGTRSFAIDTKQVHQLWVAVAGQHWQLEVYRRDGTALAVLAADPFHPADHWHDLLNALPLAANRC
ncbi:MAG: hypothetical protein HOM03_12865 [Marinovum sp.]|nr:hypothetical protein [Marinovum sp.]MBT6533844.1 hypothetical protein [Marinovum sp.]